MSVIAGRDEKQPKEPMVKFNGSGFGIRLSTLITMAGFIFFGGGAYYLINYQIDRIQAKLTVAPSEVQSTVVQLGKTIDARLEKLEGTVETARQERTQDIKELDRRLAKDETETARLGQQVTNLERLMEDIRDILRRDVNKQQ